MPEKQAEVLAPSQAALIDERLTMKQVLKELEIGFQWRNEGVGITVDDPPRLHGGRRDRGGRGVGKVVPMDKPPPATY